MNPVDRVADHLITPFRTVRPTQLLNTVRRSLDSDEMLSVIVADNNRPVGVIRWNDIRDVPNIPESCLVRDMMLPGFPVLHVDTLASEGFMSLALSDLDCLPVVDERGEFIGVFPRAALTYTVNGQGDMQPVDPTSKEHTGQRVFRVRPGMKVYSRDGQGIGLVDKMYLCQGTVTGFMVACSPAGHQHKHLGFDVVDHLEDETVLLSIDQREFLELPDLNA